MARTNASIFSLFLHGERAPVFGATMRFLKNFTDVLDKEFSKNPQKTQKMPKNPKKIDALVRAISPVTFDLKS
jgi:hypothetical protein